MKNLMELPALTDKLVEERILSLLAPGFVLSFSEIAAALMGLTSAEHVRHVLLDLQRQNAVSLRAQRRGLWFMGYTTQLEGARRQPVPDEIPQPFRELLSRPW